MPPTHELEVDSGIKLPLFCHLCVVRTYICTYVYVFFLCAILQNLEFIITGSKTSLVRCNYVYVDCTNQNPPSYET